MGTQENGKKHALKILVVDDDDLSQRLLDLVLSKEGHTVTYSYDGYDAVKLLEQEKFDLVFMDIQIPRIDGFEVAEHIRNGEYANKTTPCVALTAMPSRNEKLQNFLDRGMFNQCIHKPFDTQQIQETLVAVKEKKVFGVNPQNTRVTNLPLERHVLNVEKVLPIFSNDLNIYKEMLGEFLHGLPGRIKNIREKQQTQEWEALSRLGHNLTGITRNFGAEKLSSLSEELDNEAGLKNPEAVARIVAEIVNCVPEIEEAYSSIDTTDS